MRKLNSIVSDSSVQILRDIYVHELPRPTISEKRRVPLEEIKRTVDKVSKAIVYHLRIVNGVESGRHVKFEEKELKAWVWKEFLQEEIEAGKTTGMIADEIGKPLGDINAFI